MLYHPFRWIYKKNVYTVQQIYNSILHQQGDSQRAISQRFDIFHHDVLKNKYEETGQKKWQS